MDSLSTAINTIPFYERNEIDQSLFSETDFLSMNNRASKYKLKYFNDKTYSTPETDAQERIFKSLKDNLNLKDNETKLDDSELEKTGDNVTELDGRLHEDINLDFNITKSDSSTSVNSNKPIKQNDSRPKTNIVVDDFDDEFIFKDVAVVKDSNPEVNNMKIESTENNKAKESDVRNNTPPKELESKQVEERKPVNQASPKEHPVASKENPVIESPEDLEKWLDDLLDS